MWDLTGKQVTAKYLGQFAITGTVTDSRVKYGGAVQNTIKLDQPITVYGAVRDTVLINTDKLTTIE